MTRSNQKPEEHFDLGYVIWEDANSDNRTTHEVMHAPIPLLTAGIITRSDAKGVTIAQDFSSEGSFREIKFIPRVNIRQEKVLAKRAIARCPQWAMFPVSGPMKMPTKAARKSKRK